MPDPFNVGAAARGASKLAGIAKIVAALRKVQAANTTGLNQQSSPRNNGGGGGGGGGGAAPVSTLAGLPQGPVLDDLLKRGLIKEGMPPEQALAIMQVQGMLTGLPIDIEALKKSITADYEKYTGDITTAGADWMKQMMGQSAPSDPAMLAMFQADPMFSSYAGGITQMDETADSNLATDLAWFDKQQQAMNDYYSSLQLGIANGTIAGPAPTGGGGGGGGGGGRRGYGGGGGGGGSGYGDHDLGFSDQTTTITGQQQIKESAKDSWDYFNPGFYEAVEGAFADDPESLLYAQDVLERNQNPEDVLEALSLTRDEINANLAAAQEVDASNAQWEAALPLDFEDRREQFLARTGSVLGDDPGTPEATEWIYGNPEAEEGTVGTATGQVSTDPRDPIMMQLLERLYAPSSHGVVDPNANPEHLAGLVSSLAEVKRLAGNRVASPDAATAMATAAQNVGNQVQSTYPGPPAAPATGTITDLTNVPSVNGTPLADLIANAAQEERDAAIVPELVDDPILSNDMGTPIAERTDIPPETMDMGALLSQVIGGAGGGNYNPLNGPMGNVDIPPQAQPDYSGIDPNGPFGSVIPDDGERRGTSLAGGSFDDSNRNVPGSMGALLAQIIGGDGSRRGTSLAGGSFDELDEFGGGEFPSSTPNVTGDMAAQIIGGNQRTVPPVDTTNLPPETGYNGVPQNIGSVIQNILGMGGEVEPGSSLTSQIGQGTPATPNTPPSDLSMVQGFRGGADMGVGALQTPSSIIARMLAQATQEQDTGGWGNQPEPTQPEIPPQLLAVLGQQQRNQVSGPAPSADNPAFSSELNQALRVMNGLQGRSVSEMEDPALTPEEWQADWVNSPTRDIEGALYEDDPLTQGTNEGIRGDALRALTTMNRQMITADAVAQGFEANMSGLEAYKQGLDTNQYHQQPLMTPEEQRDAGLDLADVLTLQNIVRQFDPNRGSVWTASSQDNTASQTYTAKAVAKSYSDALLGLGLIPNVNTLVSPSDIMVAPEDSDVMPESLEPQEPEEYLPPDEYAEYMEGLDLENMGGGRQGARGIRKLGPLEDFHGVLSNFSSKPDLSTSALKGAGQMDLINNAIKAANAQKIARAAQSVSRSSPKISSVQRNQVSDVVKGLTGVRKLANVLKGFK